MPVQSCSNNGNPGYKWGEQGACYTYPKGNLAQKKKAKRKAYAKVYYSSEEAFEYYRDVKIPVQRWNQENLYTIYP